MTELQTPAREISSADVEAYLAAGGKVTLGEPAVAPGADAPNVKIAASRSRRQAKEPEVHPTDRAHPRHGIPSFWRRLVSDHVFFNAAVRAASLSPVMTFQER